MSTTLMTVTPEDLLRMGEAGKGFELVNGELKGTKIEDWLQAGVRIVWEIYPPIRVVRAHTPGATAIVFRASDALTAPDLLPGFSCPVAELFQLPGEGVLSPASPPVTPA